MHIELSESQPERNKKTEVQEKERALVADSFSEGIAQLSELNSKMDSLKVVGRNDRLGNTIDSKFFCLLFFRRRSASLHLPQPKCTMAFSA